MPRHSGKGRKQLHHVIHAQGIELLTAYTWGPTDSPSPTSDNISSFEDWVGMLNLKLSSEIRRVLSFLLGPVVLNQMLEDSKKITAITAFEQD